jgi:hypothetical protein
MWHTLGMTYSLQLQIEFFRLLLEHNRKGAREEIALSQQMREQALAMRLSAHDGLEQRLESLLKAQPIATVF